ncbi:MAG TPA: hypothetical protein VFA30_11210 [Gaiellaceae bacterium]|nr:hypothetical protein [Gaiellaceae bacterium]
MIVVAAGAAGGLGYALSGGTSAQPPLGAVVRSLDLSGSAGYESLALVRGRLILSGGPNGSLYPSASVAASPHWPAARRCWSAVVDPGTLKLSHRRTGACDDPRLYGVDVLPVNFVDNGGRDDSTVRIARATRRGYAVGPVVLRYTETSDTDAEWIYGDGFLWIYEPDATGGSELLQVSATTGAVVDRIPMPMISRPLLAVDADGLWFAPSGTSAWNGHPVRALYRVAPGARRPQIAARQIPLARWLVAKGHAVWVGGADDLWRFGGPDARPELNRSLDAALGDGELGYGEPGYVVAAGGVWTVVPRRGESVIRLDPKLGRATLTVALRPRQTDESPPLVVFHGAAFVLDPPAQSGAYPYRRSGFSALYRVTRRAR